MKLELDENQIISILEVVRSEYIKIRTYYQAHTEEEVVGVPTPKELRNTYNKILKQVHDNGKLKYLQPIGMDIN